MRDGLFASLALASVLAGCVQVRLDTASLLSPDQGPALAELGRGYRIEQGIIARKGGIIGITHAYRAGNRSVILFCGGDSFRRSREGGSVLEALTVDADVVLFDYPGFGDSTGVPTAESLVESARAVHRFIAGLPGTRRQRVVVYGFSLGGMVAAQLASQVSVDAVVLESTAANVASWARSQVPWYASAFVRIDVAPEIGWIDSVRALQRFSGPVLVLSGSRDRRVPPNLSREIARRLHVAGLPVELHEFPGAGHGEIHRSGEYEPVLRAFLAAL